MRTFRSLFLIIILLTALRVQTIAQVPDNYFIKSELQFDFRVLRARYEEHLANLYLYSSKPVLDHVFDSLYENIRPMTGMEFYSYVTPLSSYVRDGHSNLFPAEATTERFNNESKFFPFDIYRTNNKMFVYQNLSDDTTIIPGSEILFINGMSADSVMNYLLARQVRDGNNDNYALWILNNYFREYFSYHFSHPDSFALRIRNDVGVIRDVIVNALGKKKITANRISRNLQSNKGNEFQFKVDSTTSTGVFTIRSWDTNGLNSEIEKVFQELNSGKIEKLILDLRDNQGGNFMPAIKLLSHLLDQPFQYFEEIKSLASHGDSGQVLKSEKGRMLNLNQPVKNPFRGKVCVLINGGSFSNTASFCSRLQFYKRAIFLGQEKGGNKIVFSGVFGLKGKTVLPNTKIVCDNANYRLTVTDFSKNTGHGVIPDYIIEPTVKDLIEGRDLVLPAALDLLRKM